MSHFFRSRSGDLRSPSEGRSSAMGPFLLFAIEGALFQYITSFNGFGTNLFAVGIGASDAQIGLIPTVSNCVALLLLLPLGILADRLRSSRTITFVTLLCMAGGYLLMSVVPLANEARFVIFYAAIAFTLGGPQIYNAQWKNFFGDVIGPEDRNDVLARRSRWMYAVGIAAPIVCSMIMRLNTDGGSKLKAFQFFFLFGAVVLLVQAFVVHAIKVPEREAKEVESFPADGLKDKLKTLLHSRSFMMFFIPISLFYMAWQVDSSVWFIGQVQYIGLTDAEVTLTNGIFCIGQLIAVTVFARLVQRRSPDFAMLFGCFCEALCPLIMVFTSSLPADAPKMLVFTLLTTTLLFPECTINLCVVQILLRVAPKECRSIGVSLHMFVITLTNCFLPFVGVTLYTAFGSNFMGLLRFESIVLAARFTSSLLLLLRYRRIRNEVEPHSPAAAEG